MTTILTGTQVPRVEAALENIEAAIRNLTLANQTYHHHPINTLLGDRLDERALRSIATLKVLSKGLRNALTPLKGGPTP